MQMADAFPDLHDVSCDHVSFVAPLELDSLPNQCYLLTRGLAFKPTSAASTSPIATTASTTTAPATTQRALEQAHVIVPMCHLRKLVYHPATTTTPSSNETAAAGMEMSLDSAGTSSASGTSSSSDQHSASLPAFYDLQTINEYRSSR